MQKAEAQSDLVTISNETDQMNSSLWDSPIESLANLSLVASQKDAAFLYLPIKGAGLDKNITKEVQSAVSKAQSKGMTIALFVLDANSDDYAQLTRQVPAPYILVVVKGCNLNTVPADISIEQGMSVVSGDISEENLLYGLVAASRPSTPCCVVMPTNKSASTKCC